MRRGNKISFASNTWSVSHATILSQTLDTTTPDEHPSSSSSSSTSDQHPTALCCSHRLHYPPSPPPPPLSSSSSSFGTPVLSSLFSNSPDPPKTQSTPELRLAPPPSLFSFHPDEEAQFIIPVIGLKGLSDRTKRKGIVADVAEASEYSWGFFQIFNHGMPVDVLEEIKNGVRGFFEQDTSEETVLDS
ncbi:hypothetical protein ABKV19_025488 [Rosa sericea]